MTNPNPFRYFRTSREVIRLAVMLYVRFALSLRNVEDLLHERGIEISHETVRFWWQRFDPMFAAEIRKKRAERLRSWPPLLLEPDVWIGKADAYALEPMREKRAEIHRSSRRRCIGPLREAGYTSAIVITKPDPTRPLQSGGVHIRPQMAAPTGHYLAVCGSFPAPTVSLERSRWFHFPSPRFAGRRADVGPHHDRSTVPRIAPCRESVA